MKKATLGLSLAVESELWTTSSSINGSVNPKRLKQLIDWAFEEGCRRLQGVGWLDRTTAVTFGVVGHADSHRVGDFSADMLTHVPAEAARRIVAHLFLEATALLVAGCR